ncbi:TOMM precursor leader peptide-binding protein [Streptomyces sp. DSM 42041]|uniref:TOMM leader peptide-binding protein n=1 Tax=Streptomyces hazeniae TaxID=3075538 RepID=A0ABU2NN98_9ACTN|nr:TOMM precursor leader peptide-binding protein [Streptomyces sp. DSM 42041]MDT0378433.1 TOMM precursor leader peptide-binding protein [Streptomyces sp. DSM 42041]
MTYMGFRSHLRAEVVSGEATYVLSERGITTVSDSRVEVLAPLLDGTRDFRALVADAAPACSPVDVALTVGRLHEAHLLSRRPAAPVADVATAAEAYWEIAGAPGAATPAAVRVLAVGGADREAAVAACTASGLTVVAHPQAPADATLVVCDDYLDPDLADVDAEQRAQARPWLLAKPHGTTPWVGPFFQPGNGACWHCLAHRLSSHRRTETYLRQTLGRSVAHPRAETPASLLLGLQLAVSECVKWAAGHRHSGQHGVLTFDTLDLASRSHPLRARPQCPECGDAGLVARRVRGPLEVRSRPKAEHTGSGHRAVPAEETLRTYEHLISPVTGVVKDVQRDTRGPALLHSYRAGHNHASGGRGDAGAASGLRSESGGKGMTALDARVSALCESLERHSGIHQGDEPTVRTSLRRLGGAGVHPNDCLLYDERQGVPAFDENALVDWTPVWSLTRREHRMLPTALLYFDAPRPPGLGCVTADSNGNAGGSSIEDAVVQGFLELVERDAVALWWYNRTRHPEVDLGSFREPWIERLRELHLSLGREFWVLDLTTDFGIPAFAAVTRRADKAAEDILFGFGAHFDPAVAVCRALAEMNQMMPAVAEVRPDGTGYGCPDERLLHWWRTATVAAHPYLLPDPDASPRTRADFAYTPRGDLRDDLHAAEEAVRTRGMELLVLEQTRPDVGLPVAKVLVPGMRHFWARLAPGRLFDVPVRLGRLTAPTPYAELNPTPMFL